MVEAAVEHEYGERQIGIDSFTYDRKVVEGLTVLVRGVTGSLDALDAGQETPAIAESLATSRAIASGHRWRWSCQWGGL